jgi:predicted  nucleic acid-binding Zn-ribbon protein
MRQPSIDAPAASLTDVVPQPANLIGDGVVDAQAVSPTVPAPRPEVFNKQFEQLFWQRRLHDIKTELAELANAISSTQDPFETLLAEHEELLRAAAERAPKVVEGQKKQQDDEIEKRVAATASAYLSLSQNEGTVSTYIDRIEETQTELTKPDRPDQKKLEASLNRLQRALKHATTRLKAAQLLVSEHEARLKTANEHVAAVRKAMGQSTASRGDARVGRDGEVDPDRVDEPVAAVAVDNHGERVGRRLEGPPELDAVHADG